ncbi:MAG: diacylglycerol kinase family protein [Desulfobacteraceae bacterium]|jgi:diacylglycerol kinase family enzyme
MNSIGIVHNPFARRNLKEKHLAGHLKTLIAGRGDLYQTGHRDELIALAEHCLKRDLPVLGINGGDGSIHAVLTAFVSVYGNRKLPRFLILRGGTMNTVSKSLGLSGSPDSILRRWIDSQRTGKANVLRQATLNVNGKIGFIAGTGVVTRFLDRYYEGGRTGALKALSMIGTIVPGAVFGSKSVKHMFSPVPMNVIHEGRDLGKPSYTAVLASTVREVGLGFRLTSRCYEKPGSFHLIAADIPPLALVPRIYPLWAGKDPNHPGFLHHGPSHSTTIKHNGLLRWMMDGDMYETDKDLVISMGPLVEVVVV